MASPIRALTTFAATLAVSAITAYGTDEFPQFRGPKGDGHAVAKSLPVTWAEDQNVVWKTAIHGKAWSSPVISGDQIWLTTATENGRELSVLRVNRESGAIELDLKLFTVDVPQYAHPFNSYASPTPVIEGNRVYVTFGSPGVACLDAATGKTIWERRDFVCNHYRGAGSSPEIFGDLLIMNFDGSDFQYVAAVDKNTGKTVWKTDRSIDFQDTNAAGKVEADGDWRKGYSTPRVVEIDGKPVLLSLGSKAFYAYDPLTGKELWREEHRQAHSPGGTPLFAHGLIYVTTGNGRGELLAIRPGGSGLIGDGQMAWKAKRNVPSRVSPIIVDDLLYMVDEGGIASCLDAKTGEDVWRERLKGNYSASPVFADGRLYFFAEDGKAYVVAPGKEFKLLGESQLGDGFMGTPAAVGDSLYLRSRTNLYRVKTK